jgi:peptidoglycan/LPS O-acetylase OafA/YrhL
MSASALYPRLHPTNERMLLGVRGIVSLWILIGHLFFSPIYDMSYVVRDGLGLGYDILLFYFLGVDVFLMMSGCVLYLGYRAYFEQPTKSKQIDLFFLHRLARLYPLYVICIVIIGVFHLVGIPHPVFSGMEEQIFAQWKITLLLNLLLMNAWGIFPVASWNEPSWTLSVFMLLYVIFPNMVALLRFAPKHPFALVVLIFALIAGYHMGREMMASPSQSDGTGAIMRGMVFFTIGCLIARIYHSGGLAAWRWNIILPLAFATFIALMVAWNRASQFPMTVFHCLYPVLLLGMLYARGRVSVLFANPVAVWFGGISYGIYLLHYPLCLLIKYALGDVLHGLSSGNAWADMWLHLPLIAFICGVAWISERFFETPCHRFIKRRFPIR